MATKQEDGWKGGGVASDPSGNAERAADIAEGNERIRADDPRATHSPVDPQTKPPAPTAAEKQDEDEIIREKREAAAEAHRERERTGYPPFGKKL